MGRRLDRRNAHRVPDTEKKSLNNGTNERTTGARLCVGKDGPIGAGAQVPGPKQAVVGPRVDEVRRMRVKGGDPALEPVGRPPGLLLDAAGIGEAPDGHRTVTVRGNEAVVGAVVKGEKA